MLLFCIEVRVIFQTYNLLLIERVETDCSGASIRVDVEGWEDFDGAWVSYSNHGMARLK